MARRTKDILRDKLPPIEKKLTDLADYLVTKGSDGYGSAEIYLRLAAELVRKAHPDN